MAELWAALGRRLRSAAANLRGSGSAAPGCRDTGSGGTVRRFRETQEREQAFEKRDRGLGTVAVERIVGSVSRYQDFDGCFRLRRGRPAERYHRVLRAMDQGRPMAPVELYQIKNEYFVVDGNHRIAAAKERGYREVPARVVEFLPGPGSRENILYREKAEFLERTGLPATLVLTELGQYEVLLRQVRKHRKSLEQARGKELELSDAAEDWYRTVYVPLSSMLTRAGILEGFPGRTAADLYAYVSAHCWDCRRRPAFGFRIDRNITRSMEEFRKAMADKNENDYPEMMRELTAFVTLTIVTKKEQSIVDRLFALEEVREVHSVHGSIDILLKIVLTRDLLSSDAEVISDFVQKKVRTVPGILSSQTLIPGLSRTKP